jgi:hypothetical protein
MDLARAPPDRGQFFSLQVILVAGEGLSQYRPTLVTAC